MRFNRPTPQHRDRDARSPKAAPAPVLDFRSWIIFEDPWIIAVDKPAGVLSQGGEGGAGHNLVDLARDYVASGAAVSDPAARAPSQAHSIGVLHRLDRNVSGIVLLSKDARTASTLTRAFASNKVERVYEAISLVRVEPTQERFIVDAWLRKDERRNEVEARDTRSLEHSSPAIRAEFRESKTDVRLLERLRAPLGPLVRSEVRPITGRSHQIRVHLAWSGLPIVGDPKYGVESRSIARPLLHSFAIRFRHPRTQKLVEIERRPPWDDALLQSLA